MVFLAVTQLDSNRKLPFPGPMIQTTPQGHFVSFQGWDAQGGLNLCLNLGLGLSLLVRFQLIIRAGTSITIWNPFEPW